MTFAQGRTYYFGSTVGRGDRTKKTRAFRSVSPDGRKKKKSFRDTPVLNKPVALYYEHHGQWIWHAVCDAENVPDWASNYIQVPATAV